ncbi:MAG: NUDIX hydrolase [Acidimicrobiales bacterium]
MDRLDEPGAAGVSSGVGDGVPATGSGALPVDALRQLLASHRPADDLECRSIESFLATLDQLDRPYDEDADPTHVTASAVVAGRRGTVLHVHRRLGRWLQPGGHIDPGESPPAAARREAIEETGLVLDHPSTGPVLLHVDVHPAAKGHRHLDLRYLLVGPNDDPAPPPGESQAVRWFEWDDAVALADPGLAAALRRAAAWESADGGGRQ